MARCVAARAGCAPTWVDAARCLSNKTRHAKMAPEERQKARQRKKRKRSAEFHHPLLSDTVFVLRNGATMIMPTFHPELRPVTFLEQDPSTHIAWASPENKERIRREELEALASSSDGPKTFHEKVKAAQTKEAEEKERLMEMFQKELEEEMTGRMSNRKGGNQDSGAGLDDSQQK